VIRWRSPKPAVINDATARKFFPDEDPIGKRIAVTGSAHMMTIVGVAGDCRPDVMDREALSEVFWPMAYQPAANARLIARAKGGASSIANALRQVVHGVDPEIGAVELSAMNSAVGDSLWRERFAALLL